MVNQVYKLNDDRTFIIIIIIIIIVVVIIIINVKKLPV